ncbi:HD domain-containing protein [Spongiimicrobium sp. 3-5]|uniref:HD domain-containing protein n=1 Tax=Spongiimicrobium sp. 3-5 TaxID=3332596 RepID=UPI00398167B6
MAMVRLTEQIHFIKEIDKVKYIKRKTKLFHSDRHENDAEHSWHLALMAMVLAEHASTSIDLLKVIKMVLIHDIVEIDTGDIFLFDLDKQHSNTEEELKAAKRIFGKLPQKQALEFIYIWQEFEAGVSNEAKFAKALDRFQPVLQNLSNQGGTWTEYDVAYETILEKLAPILTGSETLWEYTEREIETSIREGTLKQ